MAVQIINFVLFADIALLVAADPNTPAFFTTAREVISVFSELIVAGIGIAVIVAFFLRGKFKTFLAIRTMASTVNAFMQSVVPDMLQGFEKKEIVPPGTLSDWTKSIAERTFRARSPQELDDYGRQLLKESGMGRFIDNHAGAYIKELEAKKLPTPFDVERQCFYLLLDKAEKNGDDLGVRIKHYLFMNPLQNQNIILYVGSLYLRDKYFDEHPEILSSNQNLENPT